MDFNLAVMLPESARRAPGRPALILGETRISYAQLDELSSKIEIQGGRYPDALEAQTNL